MELEQECNKWWSHLYCILHQFHHCQWNLVAHYWGTSSPCCAASQFEGCIGFIDGTFVKIRMPWNNPTHWSWFNGWKKMYCMNNTMVVNHHGLFIYLDLGYLGLFHDMNILWQLDIHMNWCQHFVHTNAYFEYLLGNLKYMAKICLWCDALEGES